MSIITTPSGYKFHWYVKFFFWNQKRKYAAILEPARLWGRSPKVFATLASLYGAFDRGSSPLEPALRCRFHRSMGALFVLASIHQKGVRDDAA